MNKESEREELEELDLCVARYFSANEWFLEYLVSEEGRSWIDVRRAALDLYFEWLLVLLDLSGLGYTLSISLKLVNSTFFLWLWSRAPGCAWRHKALWNKNLSSLHSTTAPRGAVLHLFLSFHKLLFNSGALKSTLAKNCFWRRSWLLQTQYPRS